MAEPEIARRCHTCGASIRDHSVFCPQCGKELKTTAEFDKPHADNQNPSTAADTALLHDAQTSKEQLRADISADKPGEQSKVEASKTEGLIAPDRSPEPAGSAKKAQGGQKFADARGRMQRATGLAKNVGGDVVQRGQKLREMSSVVLDEAGYDPSLRFVLVAAALFVLFLVMVLLNRFIV